MSKNLPKRFDELDFGKFVSVIQPVEDFVKEGWKVERPKEKVDSRKPEPEPAPEVPKTRSELEASQWPKDWKPSRKWCLPFFHCFHYNRPTVHECKKHGGCGLVQGKCSPDAWCGKTRFYQKCCKCGTEKSFCIGNDVTI